MTSLSLRRTLWPAVVFALAHLAAPLLLVEGASHNDSIFWNELGHNSRDSLYRSTGGAVPTGTAVTLQGPYLRRQVT